MYHLTYTTTSVAQKPCYKTGTHNCWPPGANSHVPKPRGAKETKRFSAMLELWNAQAAHEAPWNALGCQDNAGVSPETVTDKKKEG